MRNINKPVSIVCDTISGSNARRNIFTENFKSSRVNCSLLSGLVLL